MPYVLFPCGSVALLNRSNPLFLRLLSPRALRFTLVVRHSFDGGTGELSKYRKRVITISTLFGQEVKLPVAVIDRRDKSIGNFIACNYM